MKLRRIIGAIEFFMVCYFSISTEYIEEYVSIYSYIKARQESKGRDKLCV